MLKKLFLTAVLVIATFPIFSISANAIVVEEPVVNSLTGNIARGIYNLLSNPCLTTAGQRAQISQINEARHGTDIPKTSNGQYIADGCSGELDHLATGKDYLNGTPAGNVMNLTVALYDNKPASGILWFEQQYYAITGQDVVYAGGGPSNSPLPASNYTEFYNPGPGFSLLAPLQGLWAWSRNLAYVAFIILIIFVGFLILFRDRLGGDAPITIFNSIPTMVLSLVLITFSYAITSVFVDIITVGTAVMQNVLISSPGAPGYNYVWTVTQPDGNQGWIPQVSLTDQNDPSTPEYDESKYIDRRMIQPDDPQVSIWQIFNTANPKFCQGNQDECKLTNLLPGNVGAGNAIGQVIGFLTTFLDGTGVTDQLISLIMAFAVFTSAIKLFLTLLNKYIQITIGVILSPWYFFIAAIPSKTHTTIVDFLKIHLGASLTFIAIYGVFLFLIVFVQAPTTADFTWVPPLLGYSDTNIIQGNIIAGVVSFGIFLAIPTIPELIDKFLEIPEGNALVQAAGQRFGAAAGQVAGYGRTMAASFLPNVPGIGGGR